MEGEMSSAGGSELQRPCKGSLKHFMKDSSKSGSKSSLKDVTSRSEDVKIEENEGNSLEGYNQVDSPHVEAVSER
jgi:hypothetical protein